MKSKHIQTSPHHLEYTWGDIFVEYSRSLPSDHDVNIPKNIVGVALAPQEQVTWQVDGGSSQTTPLLPGSVFLYSEREFVWSRWNQPTECVHMAIAPTALKRVATECSLSDNVEIEYRVMFADPTIVHLAQLFKAEMFAGGVAGKLYIESLATVLAIHLLRNYTGLVVKPILPASLDNFMLKQVKDFIEDRLAEELTLADMAAVVHMSPSHFSRSFKAATKQPPYRYVTQRRIERAKLLLSVTQLSTAEVAYRVGFSNKSHFIAQFRKSTGTTPQRYRNLWV